MSAIADKLSDIHWTLMVGLIFTQGAILWGASTIAAAIRSLKDKASTVGEI